MFLPKKTRVLLILFIFIDLAISFNQYYNTPTDGDLTYIVLPADKYRPVLSDPFGIYAISNNSKHSEANRFFSITTTRAYFKTIPFVAQTMMSPISSIYFSAAVFKLLTQLLIILLLSAIISGGLNLKDDTFILSSLLLSIFFQVGGYGSTMGIIDGAITYTISYTLPVALFLLLLYPLAIKHFHNQDAPLNQFFAVLLSLIAFVIPFFGNQIPILVISILLLSIFIKFFYLKQKVNILNIISDKKLKAGLLLALIVCLYSFFLSFYNSDRNLLDVSIVERYKKIPIGMFNIVFGKPGLWILILLIFVNTILLKKSGNEKSASFSLTLKWASVFILIYVLLLPFDGYYEFKPNIIRRDNFLPCILILIFLFVQSSVYLVKQNSNKGKIHKMLAAYMLLVILLFTIADSPSLRKDNCQRASLEMLSLSDEKITRLSDQCTIASWYIIYDYKDSEVNATVFNYWNITDKPKLYFQN